MRRFSPRQLLEMLMGKEKAEALLGKRVLMTAKEWLLGAVSKGFKPAVPVPFCSVRVSTYGQMQRRKSALRNRPRINYAKLLRRAA